MIKKIQFGDATNYRVTREDYRVIDIALGQDITGKQIDMTIRANYDTSILLSKTATIIDAPTGVAQIVIDKNNTPTDDYALLPVGKYKYDIQLKTIATDGQRNTFQFGEIEILDHITTT